MNSATVSELSLPITGMTCSGCATTVENAIQKLPGVLQTKVDLTTNQARVAYDPKLVDLVELQVAVVDAGYEVPTSKITLGVQGMNCMSCVSHVQGALEDLPGVVAADVDLTKATAQITFVQGAVSQPDMEQAIRKVGYQASLHVSSGEANQAKTTWRFNNIIRGR